MRAVALTLSLSLMSAACFPHNARHRTYAKLTEGIAVVGGIALLATVGSGADCDDEMMIPGMEDPDCKSNASLLGTVGFALILLGLSGFVVTVSTEPDDSSPAKIAPPAPAATPAPVEAPKEPPPAKR